MTDSRGGCVVPLHPEQGDESERISSHATPLFRWVYPLFGLALVAGQITMVIVFAWTTRNPTILIALAMAPFWAVVTYLMWRNHSFSDVWLVGDTLEVKGPKGPLRVPLASVHLMDGSARWIVPRTVVLYLDRPYSGMRQIKFMPRGAAVFSGIFASAFDQADPLVADLRARIARARSATLRTQPAGDR